MADSIFWQRTATIATVTLNRPDKLNALDVDAWRQLARAMTEIEDDPQVRCIVIRGAGGKAFAAGADISEFATVRSNVDQARAYGRVVDTALGALAHCPQPTIALIEGICVGGGLEIACTCDLRICGTSSRFGIPVNRLGLTMAYGELRGLIDIVGAASAKEILFSGEIFAADRAVTMGLVNRVVPDDQVEAETLALAERIADGAPLVNRWHKKFINRLADATPLTADEIAEGYAAFDTADFATGYRAFLDKSKPEFEGK